MIFSEDRRSHSRIRYLITFGVVLLAWSLVLCASSASAAPKLAVEAIPSDGVAGAVGGRFRGLKSAAVNHPGGAGGDGNLVVSEGSRIQVLEPNGDFVGAWGYDVVAPGGAGNVPVNERQRIALGANTSGGTFKLSWDDDSSISTTAAIAFNASADGVGSVQAALEGLPSLDPGDVVVTGPAGGPWTVEFTGARADRNVAQIGADGSALTVSGGSAVADSWTLAHGGAALEKCSVAAQCQGGLGGILAGQLYGSTLALDQDDGSVWAVGGSSSLDHRRIDKFDSDGDFLFGIGWDVIPPGQPGDVSERQTVSVDASGGSFTLTLETTIPETLNDLNLTTAPIPFDAPAAVVQARIEQLNFWRPGDVGVTGSAGGPWTVDFQGAAGFRDVAQMQSNAAGLTGGLQTVTVTTNVQGETSTGFEKCTAATGCKTASAGGNAGQFLSSALGLGAVDPRNGDLLVADAGRFHRFNSDGSFDKTMGWDVVPGGPSALESCTSLAPGGCKGALRAVAEDQTPGKLRSFVSGLAIDASGSYYVSDVASSNPWTHKFSPEGLTAELFAPQALNGTISSFAANRQVTGLTVGPEDHVYAVRNVTEADENNSPLVGSDLVELDTSGSLIDKHLALSLPARMGLAGVDGAGRVFLPVEDGLLRLVVIAGTPEPPVATTAPTSAVTTNGAILNGSVDPNGLLTDYRFEYRRQGLPAWKRTPAADELAGSGDAPVPVSRSVTGLQAGAVYEYRVLATKRYGGGSDTSPVATFATEVAPPRVAGTAAHQTGPDSARLVGLVDPQGARASYRFEFGTADCAVSGCTATPVPDGDAGLAINWTKVRQEVGGLSPNVVYHLRLVATNAKGATAGPDVTFTLGGSPPTLPGRSYELVSPADKNGVDVGDAFPSESFKGIASVALAGSALSYSAKGPFADLEVGCATRCDYVSTRSGGGWGTHGITPRPADELATTYETTIRLFSADLSKFVFYSNKPQNPGDKAVNPLYLHDSATRVSTLVPGYLGAEDPDSHDGAGSDDLGVIAYNTNSVLTGDGQPASGRKTYAYDHGQVRLVSILPDGKFPPSSSLGSFGLEFGGTVLNAVSDDGRYVFFSSPAGVAGIAGANVYRRDLVAGTTTLVSPSQRTAPDASAFKLYEYATPDGARVFFRSGQKLTDDSTAAGFFGADLYRYDVPSDTMLDLAVDVDGDDPNGAEVQGIVGNTPDGSYVYYVALGEVVDGATPGAPNLFLWRDDGSAGGETRFVATLGSGDSSVWTAAPRGNAGKRTAYVSDTGRLVFHSSIDLTGHDDEVRHAYLYDPAASGGQGSLECASCRPDGGPSTSDARIPPAVQGETEFFGGVPYGMVGGEPPRVIASNGSRFWFESREPLQPEDVNGTLDVYEWRNGDVDLISSGTDAVDNNFMGASADGRDVFFRSRQKLTPEDGDTLFDVYDARAGGGFSASNLPPCVGEECRPEPQGRAAADVAASGFLVGGGNVSAPPEARRRCPKGRRAVRRKGKVHCARARHRCPKGKRAVRRKGKARCVRRRTKGKRAARHRRARSRQDRGRLR